MGDEQEAALLRPQLVDAFRHDADRIDVEAGIGLVEDRQRRLEQRHLQDVHALLLAAGEADVERALHEVLADFEHRGRLVDLLHEGRRRQLGFAARAALRVEGGAQERHGADAGDFNRILEGEEDALGRRTLVRRLVEDVLAVDQNLAAFDLVILLAGDDVGERRFAGAVRPHDRGDLAVLHGEVQPIEDGGAGDGGR